MSFTATIMRVMIASPSDIPEARDAVEKAINDWNNASAANKQIVLLPWRWETSSVPVLGGHPQSLINSQGVDECDIVIALFGSRLGSPTPDAVSGTVEEITRAVDSGKPVHLYFSSAPLPNDIDTRQLDGLREFRTEISQRGLLGEFQTVEQLGHEIWKAIEFDIAQMRLDTPVLASKKSKVELRVQPMRERELSSYDSKGKPRYSTRRWLEITNQGTEDAREVRFEVVGENSSMMLGTESEPTTIHAGQMRRVSTFHHMGGGTPDIIRIRWQDDDEEKSKEFHVG